MPTFVHDEQHRVGYRLHRVGAPAVIHRYSSGATKAEQWWALGSLFRADGPAVITYAEDGAVTGEEWYHDSLDREDGPAKLFYENRVLIREEWYLDGDLCRWDGPARIDYEPDGVTVKRAEWFAFGGYLEDGAEDLADLLSRMRPKEFIDALASTGLFRELRDAATDEEWLLAYLRTAAEFGVRSLDGIREVLDGAPPEWVAAYERAAR